MERVDSAQQPPPPSAATLVSGDHKATNGWAADGLAPATGGGTMKAVRYYGKEDLRFEDAPEPGCGKGQIKVKPAWCGICGSSSATTK